MSMLTTKERVTIAWLTVSDDAAWAAVRLNLMRVDRRVGEQRTRDAREVVAELQAAGTLVAVAPHLTRVLRAAY